MKIAISGKGGVGKTLLASLLSKIFAESGYSVIAIDADPDANLAATLGFPAPEEITPISEMNELIEERTGSKPGQSAPYYKLNPKVDDIPEKYAQKLDGIKLMRMGRIKKGGSGCYCPESSMLQALMSHLLIARKEVVIMDMEAGLEHFGRGTASMVDKLIVVVEPGRRSLETAQNIRRLAGEIGLNNIAIVGNKIRNDSDREFLIENLSDFTFMGFIPYDQAVVEADQANKTPLDSSSEVRSAAQGIYRTLVAGAEKEPTGT
ncbi:MAG: carbon monoxide dehydrogenase accessory protein CooC [Dehalococcoidales bacterium]|nr:carbon monoxide dehydrogenase accessory protein CooC [Dehalococcoidales bacterium]